MVRSADLAEAGADGRRPVASQPASRASTRSVVEQRRAAVQQAIARRRALEDASQRAARPRAPHSETPEPSGAGRPSLAESAAPGTAAPCRKASFAPGERVRHAKFGDGTVIECLLLDHDEEVAVVFEDSGRGIKRLLQSYAKLERIG